MWHSERKANVKKINFVKHQIFVEEVQVATLKVFENELSYIPIMQLFKVHFFLQVHILDYAYFLNNKHYFKVN